MSKYTEMCEAADTARKSWFAYRERCWSHLSVLVSGFIDYCQVPSERVEYLQWNGKTGEERRYKAPEDDGQRYTLPGATVFDGSDGYWHLGIYLPLSRLRTFPVISTGFVLCVDDNDGVVTVKVQASGKPRQIDLTDSKQCAALYDEIVGKTIKYFRDPNRGTQKSVGFGMEQAGGSADLKDLHDHQ
jgi:hypothetical protein